MNVGTLPFFIFLFRDGTPRTGFLDPHNSQFSSASGTVISLSPRNDDGEFTAPIVARLRQRDTGLRATADPSLLVQGLLDLSMFPLTLFGSIGTHAL